MPEIVWLNTIKQKEKRYLIDMKKKVILISVISVVIAFLATSCFDEKFTDNPSHVLSFSTDIVKFDTIFTDKGTATLSFRVYNRNNRAVRIESVRRTFGIPYQRRRRKRPRSRPYRIKCTGQPLRLCRGEYRPD